MTQATIEATVVITSDLLGELNVSEDQVMTFAEGIPGFPEGHRFALLATGREGVYWLQSIDFTALSFLLIDPFLHFPSFVIDLSDEETARLGAAEPDEVLVLVIVTLGARLDEPATANLRAPVLFNVKSRTGYQSIQSGDRYGVREAIDADTIVGQAQDR